jgi:hypothetical protein
MGKNKEIKWGIQDKDNWEKEYVRETLRNIKAAGFNVIRMWAFNDAFAANEEEERRLKGEGKLQIKPGEGVWLLNVDRKPDCYQGATTYTQGKGFRPMLGVRCKMCRVTTLCLHSISMVLA